MILSKKTYVKICPSNYKHWKQIGYDVQSTGGRGGKNTGQRIKVLVSELLSGSNVMVSCICDECGKKYTQRFCRDTDICYPCRKITIMKGNSYGNKNKGKKLPNMTGENHPRWKPNKSSLAEYSYKVRRITEENYVKHKDAINPDNYPRTLCGVDGGYQLDHRISMKWAFEHGLNPKIAGSIENLQMLPWKENLSKSYK